MDGDDGLPAPRNAEFGRGNALLALLSVPLATTLGDLSAALRICGAVGVALVVGGGLVARESDARVRPRARVAPA